jgi:superfamily I DNA and RNA helicase
MTYHNLHRRLVAFLFMYMRQEADRARTQSMFVDAGNRSHPINTCFRRHCSLLEILYYRETIRRSTMHTMSITGALALQLTTSANVMYRVDGH